MRPIRCLMMALLTCAMYPMPAHAEDSATPELQASAGAESRQQDNATDHADTIKKIIEGGPEESAQALFELTDTPNTALDHCEVLLNTVPTASGDLDLAYIPETVPLIDPQWPRPAKILTWLASCICIADNLVERNKAQEQILIFCQIVLAGKGDYITKVQALEACVRANYYTWTIVEPQDNIKEKVLNMIRMLVQPEAIRKLNRDSESYKYMFCADAELDRAMKRYWGMIYFSSGSMREEFRRYDIYGSRLYDFDQASISESEYYVLRAKPLSEFIKTYIGKEYLYPEDQMFLSSILTMTRKRQSENIKEILDLNTRGLCPVSDMLIPVYDVSLEYEKRIVDELINWFQVKIYKPDPELRIKNAPLRITSVKEGMIMVRELLNEKARSPKRTDIYRRDDLLKLITDQIMSENPESCVAGLRSGIEIINYNDYNMDKIQYNEYYMKIIANAISESIKIKRSKMEAGHGALTNAEDINECLRRLDHIAEGFMRPWIQSSMK